MRDTDWAALAGIQFMIYNRVSDSLNAALSGIALSDMPEAQDKPPGFWKKRAAAKIANVLNLFTAWSYLVRYKMGESIPERVIRPFHVNALLAWLGEQLQLAPPPQIASNPLLRANQETLQEAVLLLYSAAYSQGSNVTLSLETLPGGIWFRVKFARKKDLPPTFEALLASFGTHWRDQDTLFELTTARDFVRLNGSDLVLNATAEQGEFAFFVHRADAPRDAQPPEPGAQVAATPTVLVPASDHSTVVQAKPGHATPPPARTGPLDASVQVPLVPDNTPVVDEEAKTSPPPPPAGETPTVPAPPVLKPPPIPAAAESQPPETPTESPGGAVPATPEPPPPGEGQAAVPPEPASPDARPVIVPVKLPAITLPVRPRKPPASTSNVALTKETQTMRPARPDPAPPPGEAPEPDRPQPDPGPSAGESDPSPPTDAPASKDVP